MNVLVISDYGITDIRGLSQEKIKKFHKFFFFIIDAPM